MRQLELSDNELIQNYVNGDESALKILIQRHQKKVFSYILVSVKKVSTVVKKAEKTKHKRK